MPIQSSSSSTPPYPRDLYFIMFRSLSFKSLTNICEAEDEDLADEMKHAEFRLKKSHPDYVNLKHAKLNKDYSLLIDNLAKRALPLMAPTAPRRPFLKTAASYGKLLSQVGSFVGKLIDSYLFSTRVENELNPLVIHDLVFHYCQYSPRKAGEILNKHMLQLWNTSNTYLAYYLIEYGANVNRVCEGSHHSSLFHAITFNSSEEIITTLIDHDADYFGYYPQKHGVQYSLMLIAALNHNQEALKILIEKFPEQLAPTLETLDIMLRDNDDKKYTSEHGVYKPTDIHGKETQKFYTLQDMTLAKDTLLQSISKTATTQTLTTIEETPEASEHIKLNLFQPKSPSSKKGCPDDEQSQFQIRL